MLWGDYLSAETRTILSILTISGVPYSFQLVDTLRNEQKAQSYLAVNPTSTIPMVTDGGFKVLGGSQVLLNYICNSQAKIKEKLYPGDISNEV